LTWSGCQIVQILGIHFWICFRTWSGFESVIQKLTLTLIGNVNLIQILIQILNETWIWIRNQSGIQTWIWSETLIQSPSGSPSETGSEIRTWT
jgi:hypothetical protein